MERISRDDQKALAPFSSCSSDVEISDVISYDVIDDVMWLCDVILVNF